MARCCLTGVYLSVDPHLTPSHVPSHLHDALPLVAAVENLPDGRVEGPALVTNSVKVVQLLVQRVVHEPVLQVPAANISIILRLYFCARTPF